MLSFPSQTPAHHVIEMATPHLHQAVIPHPEPMQDAFEQYDTVSHPIPVSPHMMASSTPFRTKLLATLKPSLCASVPVAALNTGGEMMGNAIFGAALKGAAITATSAATQSLIGAGVGLGMNMITGTCGVTLGHLYFDKKFFATKTADEMISSKKAFSAELTFANPIPPLATSLIATAMTGNPVTGAVVAKTILCQAVGMTITHPITMAAVVGTALCLRKSQGTPPPDSLRAGLSSQVTWLSDRFSHVRGRLPSPLERAQAAPGTYDHTNEMV